MKIRTRHVTAALNGIVSCLICLVVNICAEELGMPPWVSAGAGIVLGLLAGWATTDFLVDVYMEWYLSRMVEKVRREREGEPD